MSDDFEIEQNISSTYVISPQDIMEDAPSGVDDDHYIARLADEGVGNASYAVLPYVSGQPADRITIGQSGVLYLRTVVQEGQVLYRVRNQDSADAWGARD